MGGEEENRKQNVNSFLLTSSAYVPQITYLLVFQQPFFSPHLQKLCVAQS